MNQMPSVEINFMGNKWQVCTIIDTLYHEDGLEAATLGYFQYRKDQAEKKVDLMSAERGQQADMN